MIFLFFAHVETDSNVEKVPLVPPPAPKCSKFQVIVETCLVHWKLPPPPQQPLPGGRRPLYVNENWGLVKIRTNSKRAPGYNEYLVTIGTCLCTTIIDSSRGFRK